MNGQYIIPTTLELFTGNQNQTSSSVVLSSVLHSNKDEYLYFRHKKIEQHLEELRVKAKEGDMRQPIHIKVKEAFLLAPRPLEERLIEQEGIIGGSLPWGGSAVESRRFWYHNQGDWFYEAIHGDNTHTIRYQVRPESVHKLVGGREFPFNEGEQETLLAAIEVYYSRVVAELYAPYICEQVA